MSTKKLILNEIAYGEDFLANATSPKVWLLFFFYKLPFVIHAYYQITLTFTLHLVPIYNHVEFAKLTIDDNKQWIEVQIE